MGNIARFHSASHIMGKTFEMSWLSILLSFGQCSFRALTGLCKKKKKEKKPFICNLFRVLWHSDRQQRSGVTVLSFVTQFSFVQYKPFLLIVSRLFFRQVSLDSESKLLIWSSQLDFVLWMMSPSVLRMRGSSAALRKARWEAGNLRTLRCASVTTDMLWSLSPDSMTERFR